MINIQALFNLYSQFMQNPNQLFQKLNIPNECRNDPQSAIQYLMNTGRISQDAYNNANNQLKQLQNNPMFRQYFK